jgi:hypothetical protein
VRERNRRRHELRRLVAGKTEHEALIARALFGGCFSLGSGTVDALFDVARLLAHFANHAAGIGVKNAIAIHVTDAADGIADTLFKIELGVTRDFAGEDNEIAFGERLASDTTQRVLLETGVENVIADGIANFIGMTFGDRFGGKDVAVRHVERESRK